MTSITVRDLEFNWHQTNKYALIAIHFKDKNEVDNDVIVIILKEIHLVGDFKTNLFIDNDIINSELIDIFTSTDSAHIESCDVTIFISIRTRFRFKQISVHIFKTTIVFSKIEVLLNIHNIAFFDGDYFLEFVNTVNFSIYAHVINSDIKSILIRNERFNSIKISRNFRLNIFNEMNCFNAFLIDLNASDLAIRIFKKEHKSVWFKKVIIAMIFAFSFSATFNLKLIICHDDITLENDVTIYHSLN